MRRHSDRFSNAQVGIFTILAIVIATYFGFTKAIPFRDHYTVNAAFKSANNIKPGSLVRIAGVNVGKVTKVDHMHAGEESAIVEMRIEKKGTPIHKDARAAIRPRIFLEGNFFVDLKPGSPSQPELGDGDTIAINQTSSPVQIDQVLTTLQTDTRKDLRTLLDELSTGLDGEGGGGFNRSIKYWEGAYRDGAIVADAQLGTVEHDLTNYFKHAAVVAEALDRNAVQLKDLITSFNVTARAFAREDGALTRAVAELPRTLRAGKPALAALNSSFPPLRRFIDDFRPAVRSSGPALEASTPFAREARKLVADSELRGLVRDLRPTVPSLARLNKATLPLYEQVRLASSCQNEVILPWSKDKIQDPHFPAVGKVYEEQTKPLGGLAGESRSGDANGQWFRVLLGASYAYPLGGEAFYVTPEPLLGVNPPKPEERSPLVPDVPCETQQPPDLRTIPGQAPKGFRVKPSTSKAYRSAVAKVRKQLNDEIRRTGLDLKVSTKKLTREMLPQLLKKRGAR